MIMMLVVIVMMMMRRMRMMMMMMMRMMRMAKDYLKWVGEAEKFNDKQGEVFQFRRRDRVVLTHHLS